MRIETVWQDLRYAARGLRLNRGFTITAILSLALGIGASVAIFTVADNLLLRPLPYRDSSQLVMLWEAGKQRKELGRNVVSPGNYFDWKKQSGVFESMAAFRDVRSVLADHGRAEELAKQAVSAELLPMLGVQPFRGRLFTPEDDRPGLDTVVIISYRLWQSWFGGDEGILGRNVQVNATPRTIIGVMPPGFHFRNRSTDLWEPLGLNPAQDYRKTQGRWMMSLARMKPGVTRDQAQSQMTAIAGRLETAYPAFDKNWTVNVEPLRDSLVSEVKTSLLVLLGAVALLLAVACANVANLLLARYTARRREAAVRASLGASRWRMIRQLLTESVLLGVTGGLAGLILARWAVIGLLALAPKDLSRSADITVDLRIVVISMGLSILTGILFGLAPALAGARSNLNQALREDNRSSVGAGGWLRSWLVGAEVAISVILLAGAGLLFRSLVELQAIDPGLNASNLLTFRVSLPAARYRGFPVRNRFVSSVIEQIEHLPGVKAASAVSYLPFNGMAAGTWVYIGGRPTPKPGEEFLATVRTVMPGYFRAIGIPLKHGRDFTSADNTEAAPHRFVVNTAFVNKYLRGADPLLQSISVLMDDKNPFGEIIGVVGDVKEGTLDKEPTPTVYYIYSHLTYTSMTFVVRAAGDPLTLAEPVRRIIRTIDPGQPVADMQTMEQVLGDTLSRQRFSSLLLSGFSITALLLAAIGIYGVLAYSVSERTREIGVRVALGAEPGRIVSLVVAAGARLVIAGSLVGVCGALALSGLLKSMLFGIGPRDPVTFMLAPLVLIAVALVASFVPARRAAKLDPMVALRAE